jgi:hypothetical protein
MSALVIGCRTRQSWIIAGGLARRLANIGPWYFAKEAFGWLDEETKNVYLTDGGHFDNLGLYELLKRRCKVIIAIDVEADPPLNFSSLIRLQRYARIDLGVLIDLPWEEIQRSNALITPETRMARRAIRSVVTARMSQSDASTTATTSMGYFSM